MTEEEQMHAVDVITRVRTRLEEEGADAELFRLRRFSSDELQILVRLELGMDPVRFMPDRYKNAPGYYVGRAKNKDNVGKKSATTPQVKPGALAKQRRSARKIPQHPRETVAA